MLAAEIICKFLLSQSIAGTERAQSGDRIFVAGQSFDTGGSQSHRRGERI
jgi:hypothetical protein